jgi:DNA segregation ATPase FtsK/SpoIIIE, S-DNA-T family
METRKNISIVMLIILSILLAVLIYGKTGYIGENLTPILGGVIGIIKFAIPVGTFVIAISIASDKKELASTKLIELLVFLTCLASIFSIYQISQNTMDIKNSFSKNIKIAYELGSKNIGGGVLGAILGIPLTNMLGVAGAVIVSVGISIIILVFILGIPVSEIIENYIEDFKERKQERKQEIKEYREQEYEQRKQKRSQRQKKVDLSKEEIADDQIKINLNDNGSKLKKYDHSEDNLEPLISKKDTADYIENNLFKKEEEKKEEKTREVLTLEHAISVEDENYEFPPTSLLKQGKEMVLKGGKKALTDTAAKLQKTLYSFGVTAKVENVSVGPAITRYELKPAEGVRVSKIANLADDIALNLAAESIRIEAPIPGKQAVGIEIPNKENEIVHLRDILESDKFENAKSKLTMALGKDVAGECVVADIAKMPHVLIAGSTGSGKSVCINTLISSLIYKAKPSEVKLVMVDPKIVELSVYNGIPHLLIPVVTDPKKAAGALAWAVQEMENRYNLFASKGVRDLKGYNETIENNSDEENGTLPQIVIIIDELADLMMVAAKDVEDSICRLAQKARAAGMHLVIATQRPSVDVITGLIKANVPSRIAFAVSSQVDSRTILDMAGAEKLLGKGDMLFYPAGASKPTRIQGAFIDDKEVEKIVDFIKSNGTATYSDEILESIEKANTNEKEVKDSDISDDENDPLLDEAIKTVIETQQASTSFIQRRFKVGYARAGRIIDQMEERGVISGYQGSKPREVLISKERWQELNMASSNKDNIDE